MWCFLTMAVFPSNPLIENNHCRWLWLFSKLYTYFMCKMRCVLFGFFFKQILPSYSTCKILVEMTFSPMFLLWPTLLLVFLEPTLLFFHCFASHKRERAHCTTAHARRKCIHNLSFLKLFTTMRSEAAHETCSSSWSCDKNFLNMVVFTGNSSSIYCEFVIRNLQKEKSKHPYLPYKHPYLPYSPPSEIEGVRIVVISFWNIAKKVISMYQLTELSGNKMAHFLALFLSLEYF